MRVPELQATAKTGAKTATKRAGGVNRMRNLRSKGKLPDSYSGCRRFQASNVSVLISNTLTARMWKAWSEKMPTRCAVRPVQRNAHPRDTQGADRRTDDFGSGHRSEATPCGCWIAWPAMRWRGQRVRMKKGQTSIETARIRQPDPCVRLPCLRAMMWAPPTWLARLACSCSSSARRAGRGSIFRQTHPGARR